MTAKNAKQTINKIVKILDFTERNKNWDYDEFDAYGEICKIINEYQQEVIKELEVMKKIH